MFPIQPKGRQRNVTIKPFPSNVSATAYFTGLDVEVFEPASIKALYAEGCYGMNPKPRHVRDGTANINDESAVGSHTLVLFPEEALFLHQHAHCLEIRDLEDNPIQTERLWKIFCNLKESFVECYIAYLYLKSKNWVIKSGIKFGGDYLLYKHGPQFHHASLVAIVSRHGRKGSYEYHTNERIAETTGKCLLYLDIVFPEEIDPADYLTNLDRFQVKELMIQRQDVSKHK